MTESLSEKPLAIPPLNETLAVLFSRYYPYLDSTIGLSGGFSEVDIPISNGPNEDESYLDLLNPVERVYRRVRELPLLTHGEEIVLATVIEKGKQNGNQASNQRALKLAEISREIMVLANLGLVGKIAKAHLSKFEGSDYEPEDIYQEGRLGLLEAVNTFDYRTGNRFSTYAHHIVFRQMLKGLTYRARSIRIPDGRAKNIATAVALSHKLNRGQPFRDLLREISENMTLPPKYVEKLLTDSSLQPLSLDTPIGNNGNGKTTTIGDLQKDHSASDPFELAWRKVLKESVESLLLSENITPRQAQVIMLHFGMKDGSCEKVSTIASRLGVCVQTVRNDLRQAKAVLAPHLKDFYYSQKGV